jgi:PST family polysaccharide transporter
MPLTSLRRILRHPISQNVVALSWIQMATFLVPLLTLPYVSRVLRSSEFGLVVFAQGFSIVLTLLIDWGFTYYGVRAVAAARENPERLAEVVSRIRGSQLVLAVASAPVALACLFAVPKLYEHPAYLVLAWIAAVGTGLMPNWYFIGIEQLRLVALVQLSLRVGSSALTFLLVKRPGDGWVVLALYAASSVAMWFVLDVLMYRQVPLRLPPLRDAINGVHGAGTLFLGTVAATMYTAFNVVLLGLFVPSAQVAHFGASERVLRGSLQLIAPIGAAVYPRLAYLQASDRPHRARQLLGAAIAVVGGIGLLLAGSLALFAPAIILIVFGRPFVHEGVPILRILVLIIPLSIIGAIAGSWLMTLHMDRRVAMIVLRAGILNIVLGCILTPLFGPEGMAWSVVSAEFLAAAGGMFAVYRTDRTAKVPLLPHWRRRSREVSLEAPP